MRDRLLCICCLMCALCCRTVRFWHGGTCVQTLEGHSDAVQCLLLLPDGRLLTGSNDRSIKLWEQHKCVHTFQGHTDTVR